MKKLISLILVFCCLSSVASAAAQDDDVTPLYEHIAVIVVSLDISDYGYAKCTGTASLDPGYTADLTLELQEFDNGWNTIASQSGTGSGPQGVYVYLNRFVVHGTYRVQVTVEVTDSHGNFVERQVETSYVERY